jgi:hypothetical protein
MEAALGDLKPLIVTLPFYPTNQTILASNPA